MKIAIIEPHYDDAWLNMGGHILLHPEHEYLILSIAQDKNNPVDLTAKLTASLPNLRTMALRLHGLPWSEEVAQQEMQELNAKSYTELFLQHNKMTLSGLLSEIEALLEGYELVALPLGLFHPLHVVVSTFQLKLPSIYYLEYPYAYFASEKKNLQRRIRGRSLLEEEISQVANEKLRLFKEIYTSQEFILALPECTKKLIDIQAERFYTKDFLAVQKWQSATKR